MKPIELRTAFTFDCEECGRENFVRGIVHEFSEEEYEDLKERFNIDKDMLGDWISCPEIVECQYCNAKFLSLNFGI